MRPANTLLAATLALTVASGPALAETYNYACKVDRTPPNNGVHVYSLKIDTKAKTMTCRGTTFRNMKDWADDRSGETCAKYCFEATHPKHRDITMRIDTATQGGAYLKVEATKPGDDGILEEADCDMIREK